MVGTRRSARANKGQHSKREKLAYSDGEEDELPTGIKRHISQGDDEPQKKTRLGGDEDDDEYKVESEDNDSEGKAQEDNSDDEGEVRCTPCGANNDNYEEDEDENGTMIQCDKCKTWQHAKCMGFKTTKEIPKYYQCNICRPLKQKIEDQSSHSLEKKTKDKTRLGVAKAFLNVFKKNIPSDFKSSDGLTNDEIAEKWAWSLESEIFLISPKKDRKYIDKSRSLMVLIKKPNVMNKIIDRSLSFTKLVNSSPEEIDDELKEYAEKVRQESIRRSILTVDDSQGQRIRRTHKGEEIVEDMNNQQNEVDLNILSRNIDHRRFQEESNPKAQIKAEDNKNQPFQTYTNLEQEDELDEEAEENQEDSKPLNSGKLHKDVDDTESKVSEKKESSEEVDTYELPDPDDDELDFILKGRRHQVDDDNKADIIKVDTNLPPLSSDDIWKGRITFPDFASFEASGEFFTGTGYSRPDSLNAVRLHNRYVKITKEIFNKGHFEIEGRLDRRTADNYLNQIVSSKDFIFVKITCAGNENDYTKLKNYLEERGKVGVLSGKPPFVKDSYILSLSPDRDSLFLKNFESLINRAGLFALFIVKKDYIPMGRSILKKSHSTTSRTPSASTIEDTRKLGNQSLESILSKLSTPYNTHPLPVQGNNSTNSSGGGGRPESFGLNNNQLNYISGLVQENPGIQQDPQALLDLFSSHTNNNYSKFN